MNVIQLVPQTELARHTHQVIQDVQHGRTAIIEQDGFPEAALVDIVDYYILRAVVYTYNRIDELTDVGDGLLDAAIMGLETPQELFNVVLAHYLTNKISLGRAAELLNMSLVDLRQRCVRLEIPLHISPVDLDEIFADVEAAMRVAAE